ncbi:unnamed protein product [Clonostachys solani]|uniref:Xylanolytic transcriptional activator regulatory domain-containing protein n=1 Tax=Clonostachys solani TaxID=160281 RepID=A0A9N9ZEE0_9HYPO|nr:unnamed protein product [Clonostachys solani]
MVTVMPGARSRPAAETSPMGAVTVDSAASDPQEMVNSMGLVLLESSNQPRFMGTSSGVTFAKMVLAAIKDDAFTPHDGPVGQSKPHPKILAPSTAHAAASFPPRHAAEHIVSVYFSYRTPHVPVLVRSRVEEVMNRVYGSKETSASSLSSVHERDMFIANIVFAVGLHGMPVAGGGRPSQSETCFHAALNCVEGLLAYSPSDLETLTVVLLLAQYIELNPSQGSLWQLTGFALRLAIDLGLHWETNNILAMPDPLLNQRRRLYWATYRFDRYLCITLGRPFGIAELSMNSKFPDPYISETQPQGEVTTLEIHNQFCSNHFLKLYTLESEIKHVLYHQLQGSSLAYPRANYELWFPEIQSRLRSWKDEIPTTGNETDSIYSLPSWWEAHYCNALLLLHRPTPRVPRPTKSSLQVCFDVARQAIQSIKTLQREGRSDEVRTAASIVEVMTASQDCASTLSALAERFADAVAGMGLQLEKPGTRLHLEVRWTV